MTQTWASTTINADPLTKIHRAIAHGLLSDDHLMSVVRPGNFYSHIGDMPIQAKPVATESDLPELVLYPAGWPLLGTPSDGIIFLRDFRVLVRSGDQRVDNGINQCGWALLRAIHQLRRTKFGLPDIIIDARILGAEESMETEPGRPVGWTLNVHLQVKFKIADWEAGL